MTSTADLDMSSQQPLTEKLRDYKSVSDLVRAVMVASPVLSREHMNRPLGPVGFLFKR
jgi:hypothetical protein